MTWTVLARLACRDTVPRAGVGRRAGVPAGLAGAAALLLALLASCASGSGSHGRESTAGAGGPVLYERKTLERVTRGCPRSPGGVCAQVRLEYPEIVGAPTTIVLERLREAVASLLLAPAPFVEAATDAERLAREFLAGQAEVRHAQPDDSFAYNWFYERQIEVLHQDERVFSLATSESWYTGGAHPYASVTLASLDLSDGRRLLLEDLVEPSQIPHLVELAERAFREAREIPAGQLLSAAGFTFPQEAFHVNDNFAVTGEGLAFHFDPYEVGPYSMGPTDYVVPRAALAPLAREGGPLAEAR